MLTQEQKNQDRLDTQEATKTCPKCKKTLPLSKFYSNKRNPDGRASYCAECGRAIKREADKRHALKNAERRAPIQLYKKCTTCLKTLPTTEFYNAKNTKDGKQSCCIQCTKNSFKKSHKKNQKLRELLIADPNYSPPESKVCAKCLKELPINQFSNDNNRIDGKFAWCRECYAINIHLVPGKYTTYAPQISYADSVKEGENGELLAECKFCKTYFAPTVRQLMQRTGALNGRYSGESNLYCSNECKKQCPTYNYKVRGSIDYILANSPTRKREVPRAFISIALADRNYQCEKCGTHLYLHVHHIEGVVQQPMFACDLHNVLVVCRDCHHEIHSQPGCSYQDYQCANAA